MITGLLPQLIVYGLIIGVNYALLGVSWGLIYGTTRTFHFAHGLVFVVAAYAAVYFIMQLHLPFIVGYVLAVLTAVAIGCLIELIIYRPLRKIGANMFVIFVASLGVLIFGQNIIQIIFSARPRILEGFTITSINLGAVTFTSVHVLMLVVSVITIWALSMYLNWSKMGRAIRGVSCNPAMAEVIGIPKDTVFITVFGIGSAVVALGAVPYALNNACIPGMGMQPLFVGFIVTFIGGAGSIWGAVAGGLILGLIENLSMLYLSTDWKIIISFLVLLVVIIVRPKGLITR